MINRYFILFLLLLCFPVVAYDGTNDNEIMNKSVKDQLSEMEARKASIFYSRCKSKTDARFTALLLFEVGTARGLLIEWRDESVVNVGTVTLTEQGLKIEETLGGIYSYDRVKKLADEMSGYKFTLFAPLRVNALENGTPTNRCANIPEMVE